MAAVQERSLGFARDDGMWGADRFTRMMCRLFRLPSALPPKREARRYVANDFLNLIALPSRGRCPAGADRVTMV